MGKKSKTIPKIYLAGGLGKTWRPQIKQLLGHKTDLYDPFTQSRQGATYEYVNDDLSALATSDIMFAVIDRKTYNGLSVEAGYAHALGIPIILVWDTTSSSISKRLDLFLLGCVTYASTDVESAADFITRKYL